MHNKLFATVGSLFTTIVLVACAAPSSDDAASTSADVVRATGRDAVRVDAEWTYAVTGTPTIGDPAETPVLTISVTVDDESVRADDHASFDGLEKPFALVPRADGTATRIDLAFQGSSLDGYIQLYPIDLYGNGKPIFLTEADLAVVKTKGITVALDTNVGTIESSSYPIAAKQL